MPRVLTWNVHGLKDDRDAVVRTLREAAPDVVALQEPPRGPLGRRRLASLAHDAGLEVGVAGGGARTTAILVRPGTWVSQRRTMRLPTRPGRTRRGLSMLQADGVRFVCLHLGLSAAERRRHMIRVVNVLSATPGAVVVAGDLNEPPGGPSRRTLGLHLRDVTTTVAPTYGDRQIDAILATPDLVPSGARTIDHEDARRASDHLPVVVDLAHR